MSEWLRNPHVQEAIRTIVIAVLVAVLGLLGYDAQIAQPRISALEADGVSVATSADSGAGALAITIHCAGGECHGHAVATD